MQPDPLPTRGGRSPRTRAGGTRAALLIEILCISILTPALVYLGLRVRAGNDSVRLIRDHQAAVFVDFLSGETTAVAEPGMKPFLPWLQDVVVLDKRPVEYVMVGNAYEHANRVPRLLVRGRDGSIYSFERVAIQYAVDTSQVATVLDDSGPGDGYKRWLMNAHARSILLDEFGRYTPQEIVLPDNKQAATARAKERLALALAGHGLEVLELSVSKPSFPEKFEQTIARRKVADQDTDGLRQSAELLLEGHAQRLAHKRSEKELELERMRGTLALRLEAARRASARRRYEADAYHATRLAAGELAARRKREQARQLAQRYTQEAEAFRSQTEALAERGVESVRAALIEQLAGIRFELAPYDLEPHQ